MSTEIASESATVPRLSLLERARRVVVSPGSAFSDGAPGRGWWFPVLIIVAVELALGALTYQRALVPDLLARWEDAVAAGRMEPEQFAEMERFFVGNRSAMWTTLGSVVIVMPVMMLVQALILWFGVAFLLGGRMRYGQALEVASWASLVMLPASLVRYLYGWFVESFEGLHLGLGVLLPIEATTHGWGRALVAFLDGLSPFAAWFLVVAVIGSCTVAGTARRATAWVVVALYLVVLVLLSTLAGVFGAGGGA
ncbi:MAG: YIP1 family protein [bacterium]